MTAADLRQADEALLERALRAERRVTELERQLQLSRPPVGARRDVRHGTGWIFFSRAAYRCHRCTDRLPRGSTYYRTYHKKAGQAIRVCYCRSCAMILGHGAPVRKESGDGN